MIAGLPALADTARGAVPFLTLVGPSESVAPGSDLVVSLMVANPGTSDVAFDGPPLLPAQVWQDGQSWPVSLKAMPGSRAVVPPGGFSYRAYMLTLPPGVRGRLILEISQNLPNPLRAAILVAPATGGTAAPEPVSAAILVPKPVALTTASTLQRSFLDHFGVLDPVYFIYGQKAPEAKFQFSLEYRLLSFDSDTTEILSGTLQFGYTQRSLWNLKANSSAFYDTSYMPSLFYQFRAPAPEPGAGMGNLAWIGVQTGYQHESNGLGSVEEHALNTLFVRSGYLVGRSDRWHAIVAVRVFDYVGGLADNPDLKDYRGYGDLQVMLARGDGPSLNYTGHAGKNFDHLTSQFDLTFPIKFRLLDFASYFLVQYFNGYGESLRDYNKPSNTVRAGLSLVR
jgi:outer membrane phospholipase A